MLEIFIVLLRIKLGDTTCKACMADLQKPLIEKLKINADGILDFEEQFSKDHLPKVISMSFVLC